MSNGLEHNNLNDISAVYLKEISEGRLKQLEKASALAASDNPDDQDKAREIRVRFDYESLKKQIGSKKKPTKPAIKEEVDCDCDCGQDPCIECGESHHDIEEGLSDWREELREIVGQYAGTAQVNANLEQQPDDSKKKTVNDKVTEKKVKNKIKINPTFQENAEQLAGNLGGQLLSIHEVLDTEEDDTVDGEKDGEKKEDPKQSQKKKMELQMKKRIIRMKLRAVNSGEADSIVAGYEPEGEELKEYSPTLNKRGGGKLGKSSIYSIKGKDESKKSFRKSHVKDVEDGYVGKGHKPTPGNFKKEELFHPIVQNALDELNRYGKETGKATGSLNKRPGTPVKKGGTSSPVMQAVRTKIRQETGKPEGQQKKVRGDKSSTEISPVDRIKRALANKRAAQSDPSQGRYPKG